MKEAASYLGVSPCSVRRLVKRKEIPVICKKGLGIKFHKEAIDEWLKQGSSKPLSIPMELPNVDSSLEAYDKLLLKGGVKVLPKGKTWNYPFGSVYLRQSTSGRDRWHIYYRVEGKRIRKAVKGAQSRADALKVLQSEFIDAFKAEHGFKREWKRLRFTEFSTLYIQNYAKVNKRSWRDDTYSIGIFKKSFGNPFLEDIGPLMIEKFKAERLESGTSKARVNRNLALLKKMFNLAIDWGHAKENPVRKVKFFSEKDNLKERILTREEEARLLEKSADHLRPIIVTALHTGMRRGEILSMEWNQVDLVKRNIRVDKTKSGKTRYIPINHVVYAELIGLKARNGKSEHVFLNPMTHSPIHDVKTAFNAATRRAGIKGLRFHDLRHTFASRLVEGGTDLITVKDLLGHHSVLITQRYTHSRSDQKMSAVQRLAEVEVALPENVLKLSTKKEESLASDSFSAN